MGTNYYITCKGCGSEVKHIGKMSVGNPFLMNYDSWEEVEKDLAERNKQNETYEVRDEYGMAIELSELRSWVDERTDMNNNKLGWTASDYRGEWS